MNSYRENYHIEYFDVDAYDHIKVSQLSNLMLQVSNNQLEKVGLGARELVDRALGWVVIQFHFDIIRLPKLGEDIVIETTPTGYNRFFCYRDFKITSAAGEDLVSVQSSWVIMDLNKRQMITLTDEIGDRIGVPEVKRGLKLPKIRIPEDINDDEGFAYRIRYYDLDANRHVNNSHYFEWMIDQLPLEIVENFTIQTIDLKFEQELRFGDHPISLIKTEIDGDTAKTYHEIKNGDNIAASGIFTWNK